MNMFAVETTAGIESKSDEITFIHINSNFAEQLKRNSIRCQIISVIFIGLSLICTKLRQISFEQFVQQRRLLFVVKVVVSAAVHFL